MPGRPGVERGPDAAASRRYGSIVPHGPSFHKNEATEPQRETADPPMTPPHIGGGAKR
jgi:hypothetical protein